MKIYQVGGSVRDEILGRKPHDFDYVVVGSSADEMLALGYKQVGKGFPVFLHPENGDEYALARREIKTGNKHTDFDFVFDASITLEDDLLRRDFTINAMAKDMKSGEVIDPFGGQADIKNKIIRHVNDGHFAEDPLRVLRMCRFAAKLGFDVAPETMEKARAMVAGGQLDYLCAERVWKEIEKALDTEHFDKFVSTARACGALKVILPEVDKLWSVPEKTVYHPEGNSGAHTLLALQKAKNCSAPVKFGLLLHDVGKGETPADMLPAHHGHENVGLPLIKDICQRLKVPNKYRDFALLCCEKHMKFRLLPIMKIGKALDFVREISHEFKDSLMMDDFMNVCRCDMQGRALAEMPPQDIDDFEKACKRCRCIFQKARDIRATDMPNFADLPKDENFGLRYREFMISEIRKKDEEGHC
uniref:Multifunctional CCA protein n=1 Tax=uncultured Alphaproteobacteria bacterium TaxID=91750 RepID=A0A6G8F339_9PROT|nr:multifunctional CCA protein [uncultured Alphaproteobacteria bacterium]